MKFYNCPVAPSFGPKPFPPVDPCYLPEDSCYPRTPVLKPPKSVHFPNDVVFLDHLRQGETERVALFIRSKRVTLDTIYPSGMAAVHEAVLSGSLDSVELLLNFGADLHQRDEEGWTPLHMACSDNYPHIARYLLSRGADRDLENDCGEKPADLIDPDSTELLQLFGLSTND